MSEVLWTAMPKAAINKHHQPLSAKYEVGTANQKLIASPTCNAVSAQKRCEL
jgi:hypothetical protein